MKSNILKQPVFLSASFLIIALLICAALAPTITQNIFNHSQIFLIHQAGWFYVLSVAVIVIACTFIAMSRYGDIKLGPDHAEPDYSNLSWFAMLFSAGMGIGLMFFGVAEPVLHFLTPPVGTGGTIEAARKAMTITFFHWGIHAWSIYAIVALILAYFSYRCDLPLRISSALYPIIGKRAFGPIGHVVDVFAILSTVFGVATTLGYGVQQVNSGLHYLFNLPTSTSIQIILIIVITTCGTLSVVTGLDKGIRRLSELNLALAVFLVLFILATGASNYLLKAYVQNLGAYLSDIVNKTFNLYAYKESHWIGGWTLLYWCWWIAWSPFVGMFIARISRGRTIREFLFGVILIPSAFTLFWMTVFGNSAIHLILDQHVLQLGTIVKQDTALALFKFLEQFPYTHTISFIATLMVIVFFVTSFDSGAMVVDMLASGKTESKIWQRIYWASIEGVIAIVLLLLGGFKSITERNHCQRLTLYYNFAHCNVWLTQSIAH